MGDFVKVAETKDIQLSKMKAVEVDGERICDKLQDRVLQHDIVPVKKDS